MVAHTHIYFWVAFCHVVRRPMLQLFKSWSLLESNTLSQRWCAWADASWRVAPLVEAMPSMVQFETNIAPFTDSGRHRHEVGVTNRLNDTLQSRGYIADLHLPSDTYWEKSGPAKHCCFQTNSFLDCGNIASRFGVCVLLMSLLLLLLLFLCWHRKCVLFGVVRGVDDLGKNTTG